MDNEINNIMRLARALTATGRYHVFTSYWGHVDAFDVYILPSNTDYQNGQQVRVFNDSVRLTSEHAVKELRNMAEDMGVLLRDATVGDESAEEWIRVQLPSYLQRQAQ